jgi:hypothetical protein
LGAGSDRAQIDLSRSTDGAAEIFLGNLNAARYSLYCSPASVGNTYFFFRNFQNNWSVVYSVDNSNGNVSFTGTVTSASDSRLKDDQQVLPEDACLQVLNKVDAKSYKRNDRGMEPRIGFIAQEMEAAVPAKWSNLVGKAKSTSYDQGSTDELKTLDYARLTAILWQVCKNLDKRVKELEKR